MTRTVAPSRSRATTVAGLAWVLLAVAVLAAIVIGPAGLPVRGVLKELVDHLPFVSVHSGLTKGQAATVWQIRFPRIVLGMLVGAMLSGSGAAYQGAFRNPLADPYLLGVAAGAGLGATIAIVSGWGGRHGALSPVPIAAFVGALGAVMLTYALGGFGRARSSTSLVLAGVAVASFLTACQTFVQQRNTDVLREVYAWILGRLPVGGWQEVRAFTPYVLVSCTVLLLTSRMLDVLAVGDIEAGSLGVRVSRVRGVVIAAASLGAAAAVAVSGLIGFVGIIVPHTVRLLVGGSYRHIVPISLVGGAGFLVLADLLARTVVSPAELPIGVLTAFIGGPAFVLLLRSRRESLA